MKDKFSCYSTVKGDKTTTETVVSQGHTYPGTLVSETAWMGLPEVCEGCPGTAWILSFGLKRKAMYKSLSSESPSETETVIPDVLGWTQLPQEACLLEQVDTQNSDNCSPDWLSCCSWGLEGGSCMCMYLYMSVLYYQGHVIILSQGLAHLDNQGGLITLRVLSCQG